MGSSWVVEMMLRHKPNIDFYMGVITLYPRPKGLVQKTFNPSSHDDFVMALDLAIKEYLEKTNA